MENTPALFWRKCSSCKKPIALGARYYVCSVSTCNGQRTGYVFCSVSCFERHLPAARHKDAGAVEKTAPMTPGAEPNDTAPRAPARVLATASSGASQTTHQSQGQSQGQSSPQSSPRSSSQVPREVLVIASRLKDYIQARSDYNTSQSVMDVLSDHLRLICDRGIDNARADGRKTVMDRDFAFLKNT